MISNKCYDAYNNSNYKNIKDRSNISNRLKEFFPDIENINIQEMFGNGQNVME